METTSYNDISKERTKTDKSLGDERATTDSYIDEKTSNVETESNDLIKSNREIVDENLKLSRERMDLQENKNHKPDLASDRQSVLRERVLSDEAQIGSRREVDKVLAKERSKKKLIAESFLSNERSETDMSLSDERRSYDNCTRSELIILSREKSELVITKSALVTRDEVVAIVSHDLKNPISAITMSAEMGLENLKKSNVDRDKLINLFDIILRSAWNMERMVSALLDVQKMENDKIPVILENGDLASVVRECRDLFSAIVISKGLSLEIGADKNQYLTCFDHDRLLQVLSNLIGNAIKFSGRGKIISITCRKVEQGFEIRVQDQGCGIPADKSEEIFEKFSQLKSDDRRGLGLGLFISKRIIEAHGGTITVSSEVGIGSIFSIFLPAVILPP